VPGTLTGSYWLQAAIGRNRRRVPRPRAARPHRRRLVALWVTMMTIWIATSPRLVRPVPFQAVYAACATPRT
jgi:hypothetical protein